MPLPQHPILVIAYNDDSRKILMGALEKLSMAAIPCATFGEAEELARQGLYSGLLLDLPAIVKAKGDEKVTACSLVSFFPTLRVRIIGAMLIPMTLAGDAKQDNSLNEFLEKSCNRSQPRRLRLYRRRPVCISTLLHEDGGLQRGYTQDLSWGGAFITDTDPERFFVGEQLEVTLHEAHVTVQVTVRWIRLWGDRRVPGFGVSFDQMDEALALTLKALLKTDPELDRDRLVS